MAMRTVSSLSRPVGALVRPNPSFSNHFSPLQARKSAIQAKKNVSEFELVSEDTLGVGNLLDRDFKEVELNENAFLDKIEAEEKQQQKEKKNQVGSSASTAARARRAKLQANPDAPQRSKDAIAKGLELFSRAEPQYQEAIDMFQLALELPGAGVYRMEGSPKEYACASEGEEAASLYNMACAYCKMGSPAAALTCLEALVKDSGFEDFDSIRNDPDLAAVRGPQLEQILSSSGGDLFSKLLGKKNKNNEKPWLQW